MMAKVIGFTATAAQTLDYLHQDKGVAGTGRRVGWAHNVNCIQASASETERMWAQLVADAPELKRQAGRSSRGRRLEKPYAHYVFSWHPADNPSGDEMMNAVRDAMQELRYGRCQYRVVCHEDKAHLHAHVIVCRVHPEHGRAMGRKNDNDVMYRWSTEYEKAQGKIRSPGRLEDITARCRYRREVRAGQQPTAPGPEAKRRRSARRHRRRNTRDAIGRPISHTKEERDEWRTLLQSNPKRGEKAALKRRQTSARIVAGNARADRLEAAARPKPTPAPVALPLAPERPRTDLARVPLDGPAAPDPKPTPARVTLVPAPERPRTDLGAVALEDPIRTPAPPGRVSLAPAPERPRADLATVALEDPIRTPAPPGRVSLAPAPERPRTELATVALEDPIRTPAPPGRVSLAPAPERPRADLATVALEDPIRTPTPPGRVTLASAPERPRTDLAAAALAECREAPPEPPQVPVGRPPPRQATERVEATQAPPPAIVRGVELGPGGSPRPPTAMQGGLRAFQGSAADGRAKLERRPSKPR